MKSGTDEAGRGPCIGPMVMATVMVDNDAQLPPGVKDSKLLSCAVRELLYEELIKLPHSIKVVEPKEIDEWVAQRRLNWLEAKYTIEMLKELNPKQAIIDCPAKNIEVYTAYIQEAVPDIALDVRYKADRDFPVAASASILAKVTRDRIIAGIRDECGVDFGSGYPSDPKTQAFLEIFDTSFPHWRKSWASYKNRATRDDQKTLF